jgi:hypothetical protein
MSLSITRWVSIDLLGTTCGTRRAASRGLKSRLDLRAPVTVTRYMTLLNRHRRAPLRGPAVHPTRPAAHATIDPIGGSTLPPSVARVADRTRLSREILAAMLEIESRTRVSLDDIERADALADRLLVRRRQRQTELAA